MGIPKFFRWLTRRYPLILQNVQSNEEIPQVGKCRSLLIDFRQLLHGLERYSPQLHPR